MSTVEPNFMKSPEKTVFLRNSRVLTVQGTRV